MWNYRKIEAVAATRFLQVFPAGGGKAIYSIATEACYCASIQVVDSQAELYAGLITYGCGLTVEAAYRDAEENLRDLQIAVDKLPC